MSQSTQSEKELFPADEIPCGGDFSLNAQEESVCEISNKAIGFKDVVYLSHSNAFYLIKESAFEKIEAAEKKFSERLSGKQGDDALNALAQADVIDGLMEADYRSFLAEDKPEFDEVTQWNDDNPFFHDWAKNYNKDTSDIWNLQNLALEFAVLKKEKKAVIEKCKKKAIKRAEAAGYVWDDGQLYSYREKKIQKCIESYRTAKKAFVKDLDTVPMEQIKKIAKELKETRKFVTELTDINLLSRSSDYSDGVDLLLIYKLYEQGQQQKQIDKKTQQLDKLKVAVADLALLGIATPEFALNCNEETDDGHKRLAEYFSHLKKEGELKKSLANRLKELDDASNHYATPPMQAFTKEYEQIRAVQQQAAEIYELAQNNVSAMPGMYLMWDVEYNPKPEQKLVLGRFPLRECILATPKANSDSKTGQLRYFSLNDLATPQNVSVDFTVKNSVRDSDQAFAHVFDHEVLRIEINSSWFTNGIFEPQAFYKYLEKEGYEVDSLPKGAQPELWESTIKKVLYSSVLRERIEPFDSSYSAQLFRAILDSSMGRALTRHNEVVIQADTATKLEASASPKMTSGKSKTYSVSKDQNGKAKTEKGDWKKESKVTIASVSGEIASTTRAEVYLSGKDKDPYWYFPETVDSEVTLTVYPSNKDGSLKLIRPIEFKPGAFQWRMYFKLWGFAAANLALENKLEWTKEGLSMDSALYSRETNASGSSTTTVKGPKVGMTLSAGCELGGYLDWFIPGGNAVPDYIKPRGKNVVTFMKLAVKYEASVEWSLETPLNFFMKDGRLHVKIRPTAGFKMVLPQLTFEGEVNPEAIGVWVWIYQKLIRKAEYRPVKMIADDDAHKHMSLLSNAMLYGQMQIGQMLARAKDRYDEFLSFFNSSAPVSVAYSILDGDKTIIKNWIQNMLPEALGPILWTLTQEPDECTLEIGNGKLTFTEEQAYNVQNMAVAIIIQYLADLYATEIEMTRRQVEETLVSMMNGSRKKHETSAQKDYRFKINKDKLEIFNRKIIDLKSEKIEFDSYKTQDRIDDFVLKFSFYEEMSPISLFSNNIEKLTYEKYKFINNNWVDIKKQKLDDDRNERLSSLAVGGNSHILGL